MSDIDRLDVVVFAAHPDDAELCAGGTIVKLVRRGYRVGVVDMTRGELGSRGTPERRIAEAAQAATLLGISVRHNLEMPDGDLVNTAEHRHRVIEMIRRYRPHVALINAPECRHPDHGAASRLCADAFYYSGLRRIETTDASGALQLPWRPHHVLHYMQSIPFEPTFVVDVTEEWDQRMRALLAFTSQFHTQAYEAAPDEPQTFVSNPDFLEGVSAQARTYGYRVGARYGEPFLYRHGPVGVDDLFAVLARPKRFV